jgi:uncharacterized membrane protein
MAEDSAKAPEASKKDVEENKTMAIVAYLGLIGVIVVLATGAHTKSPFVKFHLNQALPIMLSFLVSWIPFVGWIVAIVGLVFWLMGIIAAAQGEMKKLPVVGGIQLIK